VSAPDKSGDLAHLARIIEDLSPLERWLVAQQRSDPFAPVLAKHIGDVAGFLGLEMVHFRADPLTFEFRLGRGEHVCASASGSMRDAGTHYLSDDLFDWLISIIPSPEPATTTQRTRYDP
jgi:hypothetical protein